jgi:lysophospholipase L1-like esterase
MTKNLLKIMNIYIIIPVLILVYFISIVAFPLIYSRNISPTHPQKNPGLISVGNGNQKIKVAVIGDSTAAGQGADTFYDNFSLKYLKKLDQQKYSFDYQNFAVGGSKVEDVLKEQVAQLVEYKPDLVIVSIGANDVTSTISNQDYQTKIAELIKFLEALNTKVLWLNIPDFITSPVLLPPLNLFFSRRTDDFNQILASQIKDKSKFTLVDVFNKARDDFWNKEKKSFSADGYHPSSNGYETWSKFMYQELPSLD